MLYRSVRNPFIVILVFGACAGPPASDAEICRDVIGRLCHQPLCTSVVTKLGVTEAECSAELEMRTGCSGDDFAFSTPARERVLNCRLPLVREGAARFAKPRCEYVDEVFRNCPDVVTFLGGAP